MLAGAYDSGKVRDSRAPFSPSGKVGKREKEKEKGDKPSSFGSSIFFFPGLSEEMRR